MPFSDFDIRIEGAPKVEASGDGIRLLYSSGRGQFSTFMSRGDFRKACECGIRLLNRIDREERVVPFKAAG